MRIALDGPTRDVRIIMTGTVRINAALRHLGRAEDLKTEIKSRDQR
jgi:hypothetical protein